MLQVNDESADDDDEQDDENKYDGLTDGMDVSCGGLISEMKKVYSKKDGSEMAILKIEDMYGSFDAMLFGRTYTNHKSLIEIDKIVKIKGKLTINDRGVCVRVDNLSEIQNPVDAKVKEENLDKQVEVKREPTLYLMYDLTDKKLADDIYDLLKNYPGDSPVIVKCSKQHQAFKLKTTVNPKGFLINELHAYIDDDYIKVI